MDRDAIPVIKGPVLRAGPPLVAGVITVEKLIRHAHVPTHRHERNEGYQRAAGTARINALAAELVKGAVDLPTAVLLSLRGVEPDDVIEKVDDHNLLLRLDPEKADAEHRLYVVDGQHRILALEKAVADGTRLRNFKVVFTCMIGATESQEMEQFYVVNSNAKSVGTDLAWKLMKELAGIGKSPPKGRSWMFLAQELAEDLAKSSRLWEERIRFPNMSKAATTIPSSGLAKSFQPIANRTVLFGSQIPGQTRLQIIDAYWKAISEVYPEAFEDPAMHNLQGAIGATTMHEVFPDAYELVRQAGDSPYKAESYREHIEGPLLAIEHVNGEGKVVRGAEFWRTGTAGASASFSSGAGRRVLADMLKGLFPAPDFSVPPGVPAPEEV